MSFYHQEQHRTRGRPVSQDEEARILATPSPLLPATRRVLIQAVRDGDRYVPEDTKHGS